MGELEQETFFFNLWRGISKFCIMGTNNSCLAGALYSNHMLVYYQVTEHFGKNTIGPNAIHYPGCLTFS